VRAVDFCNTIPLKADMVQPQGEVVSVPARQGPPDRSMSCARLFADCQLAVIGLATFLYLTHETPFFTMAVLRTLVDRLRRACGAS
jgi:CRP-like cAMP-binding protein